MMLACRAGLASRHAVRFPLRSQQLWGRPLTSSASLFSAAENARVRVRYAPSPTGALHLGGLRTALFNFLFARAHGGDFLLRIEDTDKLRQKPGSIDGLIQALSWCGLDYDEGPERICSDISEAGGSSHGPADAHRESVHFRSKGGCGPYIQSQRLPIYQEHARALMESGHAYRCFCSPERLQALRDAQAKTGVSNPVYDRACLKLPAGEAARRADAGEPHVIRMMVPQQGSSTFEDDVLGVVTFAHNGIDDQVLIKSDGYPTYHLASVVDDHLMRISHVIRGQEWLSSTPKHLILYKSFGWHPPMFGHLPLLLNADRSKLSKRHGDASVEDFMASGYLPEALVNFVAFLGWSPPLPGQTGARDSPSKTRTSGDTLSPEVMDLPRMVELFRASSVKDARSAISPPTLCRINKANAVVDVDRLDFFNGQHIRKLVLSSTRLDNSEIPTTAIPLLTPDSNGIRRVREAVRPMLAQAFVKFTSEELPAVRDDYLNSLLLLQRERARLYSDFPPLLMPFLVRADSRCKESSYARWMARQGDAGKLRLEQKLIASLSSLNGCSVPEMSLGSSESLRELLKVGTNAGTSLSRMLLSLQEAEDFQTPGKALEVCKSAACEGTSSLPNGIFMPLVRYIVTGSDVGASLADTMHLLGRDEIVERLKYWLRAQD